MKEAPHQTLLRAIEKVASGEGYVDPALMPALLTREREEMLTVREREILQLLADGMSNADVARGSSSARDGEKPRPAHPRQARGGHAHPCSRHRAAGIDHRLVAALGGERGRLGLPQRARHPRGSHRRRRARRRSGPRFGEAAVAAGGLVASTAFFGAFALYLIVSERRRHESAEDELQAQAIFLESLVDSIGAVSSTLDAGEILDRTCEEAKRLFDARSARILPAARSAATRRGRAASG